MSFLRELLAWLFSHALALAVIVALLLFFAAAADSIKQHSADLRDLEIRTANAVSYAKSRLDNFNALREKIYYQRQAIEKNSIFLHPQRELELRVELFRLETELAAAEKLLREARAASAAVSAELVRVRDGLRDGLIRVWRESGLRWIIYVAALLFLTPMLWKIFTYFILARAVEKFPPHRSCDSEGPSPILRETGTVIEHELSPGEELLVRSRGGDWAKKRSNVKASARLIWSWRYPLVSFAADLCELTSYTKDSPDRPGRIGIACPLPDVFMAKVELPSEGGLIIRPRHLAALSGSIQIRTRWSFKPQNLISGHWRQIILSGPGTVFLAGNWGVERTSPAQDGSPVKVEQGLLLACSPGAAWSLCRTQTFWHYFRNQAALFDCKLCSGVFFTQNNTGGTARQDKMTGFEKVVNAFLNAIGGLLGF